MFFDQCCMRAANCWVPRSVSCSPSRTLAGADTAKRSTLPRRKAIFYTMSWMRSFEGAHFAEGSDSDDEEKAAAEAKKKAKMAAAAERPANSQEQPFASMSASADAQEQGAPAAGARAPATADFLRMPGNDTCFDCDASCAEGPEPEPQP